MIEIMQQFGFPVACVVSLGVYIARVQAEQRMDSKAREERLYEGLEDLSKTNKVLLETNTVMVKDINRKLDQLMCHEKKA